MSLAPPHPQSKVKHSKVESSRGAARSAASKAQGGRPSQLEFECVSCRQQIPFISFDPARSSAAAEIFLGKRNAALVWRSPPKMKRMRYYSVWCVAHICHARHSTPSV